MSSSRPPTNDAPGAARQAARSLRVERLGLMPYGPMLAIQEARQTEVSAGTSPDTLFLLEHEPVITTGRNTGAGHVLAAPAALQAAGVSFYETGRGGDVTYHGPGQIVGYPILALQPHEQDVRHYVYRLEDVLIRTALDFGVTATRVTGLRGIWVGNDKLAAIGVRLSRWVTMHGFALNVQPNLGHFNLIVPCGLHDRGVTSLAQLLGRDMALPAVTERLVAHFTHVFDRPVSGADAAPSDAAQRSFA